MRTSEVPTCCCLECGHEFNRASDVVTDNMPAPGDVSVCIECGSIAVFRDDLTLRCITEREILALPLGEISKLQAARTAVLVRK